MAHTCHARGCARPIKPEFLMCGTHWSMVPYTIQQAVWATYRPGQCDDKDPAEAWHQAADAAIGHVALQESQSCTRAEVRALIAAGYEKDIVEIWTKRGLKYKKACEKVIAELKAEKL
jgi:hypothetical protein